MRNSALSGLYLLEGPLCPVMLLRAMCGSVALVWLGLRMMSEDQVIT